MNEEKREKSLKNNALGMGILYAIFTLGFFGFYGSFWILGLIGTGTSDLGMSILKGTPFLYHFFFASLLICVVSFLIFVHQLVPFGKDDPKKNQKIDVILFSLLTVGFVGFILALPMLYLWILCLKKIRKK